MPRITSSIIMISLLIVFVLGICHFNPVLDVGSLRTFCTRGSIFDPTGPSYRHCCHYWTQTDIGKIQTRFRPKQYWNSDHFWPFSLKIQTYRDSLTWYFYDYVNLIYGTQIMQTNNRGDEVMTTLVCRKKSLYYRPNTDHFFSKKKTKYRPLLMKIQT